MGHVGQADLPENYLAAGLRLTTVTHHTQTIELQWKWDPPQQVCHEN